MKKVLLFLISISILSNACKKQEDLDPVLYGTWNVTKVEGVYYLNNIPVTYPVDNNPTGTINFNSNGTGKQDYSYSIAGTVYPQNSNFIWEANAQQITIDRTNEPDMTWTRVLNEANKQVATYTYVVDATQKWDYTLTLEK